MLKKEVPDEEVPYVKVPLHTLMRLEWGGDEKPVEKRWRMDIPGADTHREAQAKRKPVVEVEVPTSPVTMLSPVDGRMEWPVPDNLFPSVEAGGVVPVAVAVAAAGSTDTAKVEEPRRPTPPITNHTSPPILDPIPTSPSTKPVYALALTPPPGQNTDLVPREELVPMMVRVPSRVDVKLVAESQETIAVKEAAIKATAIAANRMRASSFSYGDSH